MLNITYLYLYDNFSFTYASTSAPVQYTNWAKNSFTDAPDNTDNSEDCTIIKVSSVHR